MFANPGYGLKIGFDASWQLPYKIVGRNGVELNTKWKPHPTSYLSMCVDSFPNMFMSLGPNSVIGAGVLLPIIEYAVMYAVQATAKMQRERLKSMEVKLSAVKDFDNYIEVRSLVAMGCLGFLADGGIVRVELLPAGERASVFTVGVLADIRCSPCLAPNAAHGTNWAKKREESSACGQVRTPLGPYRCILTTRTGSNLHAVKALQYPRWEDYEYERADAEGNSLYWLGDGQSLNEKNNSGDSTSTFWVLYQR